MTGTATITEPGSFSKLALIVADTERAREAAERMADVADWVDLAQADAAVVLGGGQSAASTALQQNGQISPTVRVRMGEPIRVFTARDLDFSQAPQL